MVQLISANVDESFFYKFGDAIDFIKIVKVVRMPLQDLGSRGINSQVSRHNGIRFSYVYLCRL